MLYPPKYNPVENKSGTNLPVMYLAFIGSGPCGPPLLADEPLERRTMDRQLLNLIAAENCFVREFLELRDLAVKLNLSTDKVDASLTLAVNQWKAKYPRLFSVFQKRSEGYGYQP